MKLLEKEKQMFDLEKFASGKYYVHLPTLGAYNKAMKYLDDNGFKWLGGQPLTYNTNREWDECRQQMCISYEKNQGLRYGELGFYKSLGFKQLEINKVENEGIIEVKIKRDLIKLLFQEQFGELAAEIKDFIKDVNKKYGLKEIEIAKIIVEELKEEQDEWSY